MTPTEIVCGLGKTLQQEHNAHGINRREPWQLAGSQVARLRASAGSCDNRRTRCLGSRGPICLLLWLSRLLTIVGAAVKRLRLGAAGAGRDCAPAALVGLSRPAPQLHR